ncbi:hypothetical protein RchiOBHm_Chr1g0374641 [Rosa chinensis]|uniref:Uncharacterized protein n=1 Tax=Rosa chinensis TaxID=74649 RepID=A0A2P6SMD6_ROSCH|nr:hypothetical protein RchiOBHm_Chr1g0374641 [Rosa chinensis]
MRYGHLKTERIIYGQLWSVLDVFKAMILMEDLGPYSLKWLLCDALLFGHYTFLNGVDLS